MADKTKDLKKKLFSQKKNGWDRVSAAESKKIDSYCKHYMAFLDAGKTERLCAAEAIRLAEKEGYVPYERGMALKSGDKVYVCNRGKGVMLALSGEQDPGGGRPDHRRPHRLPPSGPEAQSPL